MVMAFSNDPTLSFRCTSTRALVCCVICLIVEPCLPIIAPTYDSIFFNFSATEKAIVLTISLCTRILRGKSAWRVWPGKPPNGAPARGPLLDRFSLANSTFKDFPSSSTPFSSETALKRKTMYLSNVIVTFVVNRLCQVTWISRNNKSWVIPCYLINFPNKDTINTKISFSLRTCAYLHYAYYLFVVEFAFVHYPAFRCYWTYTSSLLMFINIRFCFWACVCDWSKK